MKQGQNNKPEEEKALVKITGATDLLGLSIPLKKIIVTVSKVLVMGSNLCLALVSSRRIGTVLPGEEEKVTIRNKKIKMR